MEKAVVIINGKEYELRFTIGFWAKMKALAVTQETFESKLKEDFANIASNAVYYGIYYGMQDRPDKPENMGITITDIEGQLDRSVMDVIERAIINGMTAAEKRLVEMVKKQQEANFKEAEDNIDSKKK